MTAPPYAWLLVLGLLRVAVVGAVSFVVLTRLALPATPRRSAWEGRAWGDAVLGVSATLTVAFGLGLLGLFDAASLAAALALALAGGAWLRYRRLWRRTLLRRYAGFLEWVERVAPPGPVVAGFGGGAARAPLWARLLPRPQRTWADLGPRAGWWAGVGVVSAVAVAVRLVPTLAEPAPFTLRYYASLETLKGLMVGAPAGSGGGWGLQALVMALAEMARVDPALVLRGVGAVAAGAVAYGVFQTVRFTWGGRGGAFAGALFVAVGGPLLPLPLDRQAGAEPLMLAAALALPVFPHLAAYLGDGNRRGVTVGLVGLVACGLVNPAVGALLAATVAVYVVTIVVQVRLRARRGAGGRGYRDRGLSRRVAFLAAVGAVVGALWAGYVSLLNAVAVDGAFVFFESTRGAVGTPGALAAWLGALLLVAPLVPGRARHAEALPRAGALVRSGGQTLALLALWVGAGGGYEGVAGAAAVLLMSAVGVDLGLLVHEAWVRARPALAKWAGRDATRRGGEAAQWAPSAVALGAGVAVIVTGWGVPVPGVPVEPAGFVHGYHAVQRASLPYAWTAVSHLGTGVRARHRGRFMDSEYFLQTYDPARYDHRGPGAIPTPDVYLFVERGAGGAASGVRDELLPVGAEQAGRLRAWVAAYAARPDQGRNVSVVYRDAEVEVVRLSRPAPTLLELPPEAEAPPRPARARALAAPPAPPRSES